MEQYKGRAIVQKIAAGRIWFYTKEEQSVKRYRVEDTEKEWKRYEAARDEAVRAVHGAAVGLPLCAVYGFLFGNFEPYGRDLHDQLCGGLPAADGVHDRKEKME